MFVLYSSNQTWDTQHPVGLQPTTPQDPQQLDITNPLQATLNKEVSLATHNQGFNLATLKPHNLVINKLVPLGIHRHQEEPQVTLREVCQDKPLHRQGMVDMVSPAHQHPQPHHLHQGV